MKATTQRQKVQYSDDQIANAESVLQERVNLQDPDCVFFVCLGQSGNSKDVRFVLYRLMLKVPLNSCVDPYKFICPLSDNLMEACFKAKKITGTSPVELSFSGAKNTIDAYTKYTPDVVRFGKNKGLKISECDDKFIVWVAKGSPLYDEMYESWVNHYFGGEDFMKIAQQCAIEKKLGVVENDKFMTNEQYEKYKASQELLKSLVNGHFYQEKQRVTLPLTVLKVTGYESQFGYISVVTFKTEQNMVFTYKGSTGFNFQKGCEYSVTGTIKHGDYKEQPVTYLQRIKVA